MKETILTRGKDYLNKGKRLSLIKQNNLFYFDSNISLDVSV